MQSIVLIGILTAVALLAIAAKPKPDSLDGMEDTPVDIKNIREGVKNGWYVCTLVMVDGVYAVHLSGRTADGKPYSDVYPITKEDWYTLKNEGYKVE